MAEIITIANQKGGVGKTTTAVNLAAFLGAFEKRVLIIDGDSQSNTTTSFGFSKDDYEFNLYHILSGIKSIDEVKLKTVFPTLDLIPSDIGLMSIERELQDEQFILKNELNSIKDNYDYIIIDTPPTLGIVTINALNASDSVIIPVQTEYFAMDGLKQLLRTINLLQHTSNPKLKIKGILPTMYAKRNNLSKQVLQDLRRHFENYLFKLNNEIIAIPRNVKLAEAPSFGIPIILYDSKSSGAKAYENLAKIILSS